MIILPIKMHLITIYSPYMVCNFIRPFSQLKCTGIFYIIIFFICCLKDKTFFCLLYNLNNNQGFMTLFYTILTIGSITDFKNLRINSHFRGTFIVFREVIVNSDHTTKCLMWLRHSGKKHKSCQTKFGLVL